MGPRGPQGQEEPLRQEDGKAQGVLRVTGVWGVEKLAEARAAPSCLGALAHTVPWIWKVLSFLIDFSCFLVPHVRPSFGKLSENLLRPSRRRVARLPHVISVFILCLKT